MRYSWLSLLLTALFPLAALAIGPHEILVLVNEVSPDSVEVGKEYVRLRQVPRVNLVRLHIHESFLRAGAPITPRDFRSLVWLPAIRAMKKRDIAGHILAWVYSTDFPVAVKTSPVMSIQGITFLRGNPVRAALVKRGEYSSPFFAGPGRPSVSGHYPQTLDSFREWIGNDMPVPSMMLGYTGKRGNSKESVLRCLRTGAMSDATAPSGTVYFVKTDDIRSHCREWQFPMVLRELRGLGIDSRIVDSMPAEPGDILGMMTGAARVKPARNNRYVPGCMAEHLTSAAAAFESLTQTKLSMWIEQGATASAGTVSEPLSIWTKFPHARFYVHYASGCSILESFFQSVRCPLQLLLVGEPLASPWAPKASLALVGLEDNGHVSGTISIGATVSGDGNGYYGRVIAMLDGRMLPTATCNITLPDPGQSNVPTANLELATSRVTDGPHTLRVIAYRTGMVRTQVFTTRGIIVKNR